MKGTPETPQCGFSRASIQILGLQGVDPAKFTAFNVLEDEALRAGMFCLPKQMLKQEYCTAVSGMMANCGNRYQRILGMANDTAIIYREGVRRWM